MLKFNFLNIGFCLLFLCVSIRSQKKKDFTCVQIDPCQCTFNLGYGINLNGLNITVNKDNETRLVFHPCSDIALDESLFGNFSSDVNECLTGTSLCLITVRIINLGPSSAFEFETNLEGTEIEFVSKYNSWTTVIKLQCSQESDQLEISKIDYNQRTVDLILNSQKSCLTNDFQSVKWSRGAVIFVVILTLILVYFIGGALFSKFILGTEGFDMIPHRSFWIALGNSIKSCFTFCISGCVTSGGYDRI